jgi:hypothetical protein
MSLAYAIGQAVFIRTDTVDYVEVIVPFTSLEELVEVCTKPRSSMTLEKVLVYSFINNEPTALTLGFIAASKGQRPINVQPTPG